MDGQMTGHMNRKKPYWTSPWTLLPWKVRYRLRLSERYVAQASMGLSPKRCRATLYAVTGWGLVPVATARYSAEDGSPESIQAGGLSAICKKAAASMHAAAAMKPAGHALTAMSGRDMDIRKD